MRILNRDKLFNFMKKHADSRSWIKSWIAEVEEYNWSEPQDVKERYASVSFLKDNVLIFNVKGNMYRLEVAVAYKNSVVSIRWIGTHSEYDKRL